ncbi:MAG: helix-turn-helix transcriptional regulator [Acidimicrobiales bacterium]
MEAIELGDFLRTRRQRLRPEDVGLPTAKGRRTSGLRREEVAVLANIGVSWLTRLEQGRANRVSGEVLDGLATALRLSRPERAHLFGLADVRPPSPIVAGQAAEPAQRVLVDGLEPNPAYVLDHVWNLVCWNRAEAALFPVLDEATDPNLLRLTLETPSLRGFMTDWSDELARLTRQFRLHLGQYPSDEAIGLVDELRRDHPEFAEAWAGHDVDVFSPQTRRFAHEIEGELVFDHHRLNLPDHPGWSTVIYTPTSGTTTAARFARVMAARPH